MASPLPPDPYLALGVAKDATAATIKTRYRKLVLQFHPDKVQDAAQKQAASDEFHKVQTAYEIIGDEDRRKRYDAQCKLAQLRKEAMESRAAAARGSGGDGRTAGVRVPMEASRNGHSGRYERTTEWSERGSPVYEERKPSFTTPEYFDAAPRRAARREHDYDYDAPARHAPSRSERERTKTSRTSKEQEKTSRKERTKKTEREVHRDRDRKQSYVEVYESESDTESEYERYPSRRRRADESDRKAREYRQADQQRRAARDDYFPDERDEKLRYQEDSLRAYTARARKQAYEPQPRRSSPYGQKPVRETADEIRAQRPIPFRTGSGRPRTSPVEEEVPRRASADDRRRRVPVEIVEPPQVRRPTTLKQSVSSPPETRPGLDRQRSQSVQVETESGGFTAPQMRRAETMPSVHEVRPPTKRSSGPRHTVQDDAYVSREYFPEEKLSSSPKKHEYVEDYRDERDYSPTDDRSYRTEVRKPPQQRRVRTPSPELERERQRPVSLKHNAPLQHPRPIPVPRASSRKTYTINADTGAQPIFRPEFGRESSTQSSKMYYGEISNPERSSRTRRPQSPAEPYRETRSPQVNYRMNSGSGNGSRRGSHMPEAPSYSRSNSYQTAAVR